MRKTKEAKERIIYNNYDIWEDYHECVEELLREIDPDNEPTEDDIWAQCYAEDETTWEIEHERLTDFFDGDPDVEWILVGKCGLWHGTYDGGFVFKTFRDMMSKVGRDCEYFKFWDKNGHFFGKCSHHDGTHIFEIKKMTKEGTRLAKNWESTYYDKDKRYAYSEKELHKKIFEKYSRLPNYAATVFGCKRIEYVA